MSVFFSILLLAGQAAPALSLPAVEVEIVVIGRQLRKWKWSYVVHGNRLGCKTTKSTGDREVDAIGCASFEVCVGRLRPRIDESDRADLAKSIRKGMKVSIKRDLASCVAERRAEMIVKLADRRIRARTGQ